MPYIIAIEYSEAQRRQLAETLSTLAKSGRPLSAKYEAENFPSWQDLFSTVIQPGLFTSRESVVIEGAESLGAFPDDLVPLLEDNNADSVIVLVYSVKSVRSGKDSDDEQPNDESSPAPKSRGTSPTKKYLANIEAAILIIKPEAQTPPWKRKDWLLDLAKSQGIKIAPEAAQLLADSIESQEELRGELSKLGLYAGNREIVIADVEALSFDEGGRAQLMFLDGICDNKPSEVARATTHLKADSILPQLTAITNRLRPALMLACFPEGLHTEALKAVGVDTTKKYNYALVKSKSALKHYGAERIKRFMLGAIRLSFLEKTNRAEGWQGFELIIWELMAKV